MAELNNRKRKLSSENKTCAEDMRKKQNINQNVEVQSDSDLTSSTTIPKNDDTPLISKSAIKSFSRFLPRNVVGTIGRKTTIITRRTLRSGRRGSLQTLNQGWDTTSTFSSLENDDDNGGNPQGEITQKRKQNMMHNYTLRLRQIQEKFKTRRQLRKDKFRSAPQERFRKDLNQSKIEINKRGKLLEKLLEEHNKHLESL